MLSGQGGEITLGIVFIIVSVGFVVMVVRSAVAGIAEREKSQRQSPR